MKKLNYTFLLIFTLILSLAFYSCTDNKAYTTEVSTADSLFTIQKLNEAKLHYSKASKLKKDEVYPTAQIKKIDE